TELRPPWASARRIAPHPRTRAAGTSTAQLGDLGGFHGGVNRFEPGGRAMSRVMAGSVVGPVAVALAIGLTSTAQAQTQINGTPGDDRIRGTRAADVINADTGDDRIGARGG